MKHPLSKFHYCPICGSSHFEENNFKSKKCNDCGFVYYFNSSAATAAFILDKDDRLLIARRANDPAKGTWDLPGGFVDFNESAEEAVIREIKEETQLNINNPRYLFSLPNIYLYSDLEVYTTDIFFECRVDSFDKIKADDDVEELFFLEKEKIDIYNFGLVSIKKAVDIWLNS